MKGAWEETLQPLTLVIKSRDGGHWRPTDIYFLRKLTAISILFMDLSSIIIFSLLFKNILVSTFRRKENILNINKFPSPLYFVNQSQNCNILLRKQQRIFSGVCFKVKAKIAKTIMYAKKIIDAQSIWFK